jgi:hypothetical protein
LVVAVLRMKVVALNMTNVVAIKKRSPKQLLKKK